MTESRPFYARDGLLVETYDVHIGDRMREDGVDDVGFYRELAGECGGPALELACGTGRVVWPLAEAGVEVVGLDRSAAMLRRAEAKREAYASEVSGRVRFVRGSMHDFELDERFGLIYVALRSFQALLEPEDQHAALRCIHRHLRPDGRLALDVFDPRLDTLADGEIDPPFPHGDRHVNPDTGHEVKILVVERVNDSVRQVFTEVWRLTETDERGRVVREEEELLEMRWIYRREMRYLLERCGFEVEAEYSDYDRSPPAYGKEQVWVARRARA